MKYLLRFFISTLLIGPAFAADVGVSINIGDPNFYGQIDIGNVPQPRFIYAQPMIIEREHYVREPMYLRVPPGHAKHWEQHCREYQACGRPVYFVQDSWYTKQYVPYYRSHGHDRGRYEERYEHRGDDRRYNNDHQDNDHQDNDRHDGRRHENGRGNEGNGQKDR